MRPDTLRRALRAAVDGADANRVVAPRVLEIQRRRSENLMERLLRGVPVTLATPPWAVEYTADAVPQSSSPAWTASLSGTIAASGGILTVED